MLAVSFTPLAAEGLTLFAIGMLAGWGLGGTMTTAFGAVTLYQERHPAYQLLLPDNALSNNLALLVKDLRHSRHAESLCCLWHPYKNPPIQQQQNNQYDLELQLMNNP